MLDPMCICHRYLLSGLVIAGLVGVVQLPIAAQIVGDATLPNNERSQIVGDPVIRINGGAVRGTNLFHSFSQFSLTNGQTAFFNNAPNITTILGRVTGGFPSTIDGTIRANGTANVFLLNPSGIVFGPNARLQVGGSFVATTASAIQFGSQGVFSATNPGAPGLLTVNPSALFFNQASIGRIENASTARAGNNPAGGRLFGLQVPDGQSLLLAGGDIVMNGGGLNALGGQIELAAIAGSGSVGLETHSNGFSLVVPPTLPLGNIVVTNQAKIITSGTGGGFLRLQGHQMLLGDRAELLADTYGDRDGIGIELRATNLTVQDGAQVSASAIEGSQGNSGGIRVDVQESLAVIGTSTGASGSGSGGGGGGSGDNTGNNERPSKLASDARGAGSAGNLRISTKSLTVRDGGKISSSTIDRPGGGNILIQATESVDLIGASSQRQRASGISVQTRGAGRAGDISIFTGRLRIQDGAELSASTLGSGAGGNILVVARELVELAGTSRDGSLVSRLDAETGRPRDTRDAGQLIGTGPGGNIQVMTDRLIIRDRAELSVSSISPRLNGGDAGNLDINARVVELDRGGAIAAVTTTGDGGNITLNVGELLLLRRGSLISTTAGTAQAGGNGGNITINAPQGFVVGVFSENSDIRANAFTGRGGNITLTAEGLFGLRFQPQATAFSDITASSRFGLNGVVNINTPDVDPSRGTVELPAGLVDANALIANSCIARRGSRQGRFVVTGHGGLPVRPQDLAIAPFATYELVPVAPRSQLAPPVEIDGFYRVGTGEMVLGRSCLDAGNAPTP